MNLQKYKPALQKLIGKELWNLLTKANVILAGGSLTSLITKTEINDFDIYFRNKKDIMFVLRHIFGNYNDDAYNYKINDNDILFLGNHYEAISLTSKSITFSINNIQLQLIHFDYFNSPKEIFNSFDFYCNMIAYDFKTGKFSSDENFFSSVASREIEFNHKTKFPINSLIRTRKYIERGYSLSTKQYLKIALAISELNIKSWNELKEQICGIYGITDKIKIPDKEFSTENCIDFIENSEIKEPELNSHCFEECAFRIENPFDTDGLIMTTTIDIENCSLTYNSTSLDMLKTVYVEDLSVCEEIDRLWISHKTYANCLVKLLGGELTYDCGLRYTGDIQIVGCDHDKLKPEVFNEKTF